MKWFKHMTDAFDDEKLAAVVAEKGMGGYGFYWRTLEILADQLDIGKGKTSAMVRYPIKKWADNYGMQPRTFLDFIGCLHRNSLVNLSQIGKYFAISEGIGRLTKEDVLEIDCPNLLKIKDNHTSNLQATNKKLASKEGDVELDGEGETTTPPKKANAFSPQGGSSLPEQPEKTATATPVTAFSEKTPTSPVDDSEAGDKAIALPAPSKATGGARKRVKRAYPEKIAALLDRFAEIRKSDDSRDVASRSIAKRIKEGHSHEELMRCIERYHRTIENPCYPFKVGNFFGNDKRFVAYLDENFTEPEPTFNPNVPSIWDMLREQGCDVPTKYSDEDIKWIEDQEREFRKPKEAAVG